MREFALLSILLFFLPVHGQTEWQRKFGFGGIETPHEVIPTVDGGCYVVGDASGSYGAFVTRMDVNGDEIWSSRVTNAGEITAATLAPDGGLVTVGTRSASTGGGAAFICRYAVNGSVVWCYSANGPFNEKGSQILSTTDNGYLIGGTQSFSSTEERLFLLKLDSLGALQWSRTYAAFNTGVPSLSMCSLLPLEDNGYLVVGSGPFSLSPLLSRMDSYMLRVDSLGNVAWMNRYISPVNDFAKQALQLTDKGFAVCGQIQGFWGTNTTNEDGFLFKTKDSGELEWSRRFGSSLTDGFMAFERMASFGFLITGYSRSWSNNSEFFLLSCDSTGAPAWAARSSAYPAEVGRSIRRSPSGALFLLGTEHFNSFGSFSNVVVMRFETLPPSICGWEECDPDLFIPLSLEVEPLTPALSTFDEYASFTPEIATNLTWLSICPLPTGFEELPTLDVEVIPNPAYDRIVIRYNSNGQFPLTVKLVDTTGAVRREGSCFGDLVELDIATLSSGLYLAIVSSGSARHVVRVVKI